MDIHKIIAKNIVGKKVLDIGFAQRPNLFIKDKIVYGIDIQEVKKPNNYEEVKCLNLNKMSIPYKNNFFDTIVIADVIEHVENPSQLLRECNRVLKNDGYLIISTPQANYFYDFFKNFIYSFFRINLDRDCGSHISNWTILDFIRLLKRHCFKIKKTLGTYVCFPFNIHIPVAYFLILGWQVIYISQKNGIPERWIFRQNRKPKGIVRC